MIRAWLLKHRWVNEFGKIIVSALFALFAYAGWEGGRLASAEIAPADSYKLIIFGIGIGVFGMLALFIFVDVIYSIIGIIKRQGSYIGRKR